MFRKTLIGSVAFLMPFGLTVGSTVLSSSSVDSFSSAKISSVNSHTVLPNFDTVSKKTSLVTLSVPSTVSTNSAYKIKGRVAASKMRHARNPHASLQYQGSSGWLTMDSVKVKRSGKFVFKETSNSNRQYTFRANINLGDGHGKIKSQKASVEVKNKSDNTDNPTYENPAGDWDAAEYAPASFKPAGDGNDWAYLYDGGGRWNPCKVITWRYDANGQYNGAFNDVKRSFAQIAGYTGLHFKYIGDTTYIQGSSPQSSYPSDTDVTVAWSNANQNSTLAGSVVGYGGSYATQIANKDVKYRLFDGFLVLDTDGGLTPGFAQSGNPSWNQVMEHELLHALGLGHAKGANQMMYPVVSGDNHFFGSGDITGMSTVGANKGCL